jgi:VWFA-related protein
MKKSRFYEETINKDFEAPRGQITPGLHRVSLAPWSFAMFSGKVWTNDRRISSGPIEGLLTFQDRPMQEELAPIGSRPTTMRFPCPQSVPWIMRLLLLCAAGFVLAAPATAQTETPGADEVPLPGTTDLHARTQLVVLDVVVENGNGQPVKGLKQEDFRVTEDKAPQEIRNFEEFSAPLLSAAAPPMPKLPPGTFTNYSPFATGGPLNILLLDALNTPLKDQNYVRAQLQQYVKQAQPGTRIAIFGLTTRLILLQGFTADPSVLKDAIEHKLIPRASDLPNDSTNGGAGGDTSSSGVADTLAGMGPDMAETAANLAQFNALTQSFEMDMRVRYTLDAFHTLGRYLSAFPGRKNLIWFSGSFPLDIMPDATLGDPFSAALQFEVEFRATTDLFTRSQVAVYPIDARGLATNPAFDASHSGAGDARNPIKLSNDITQFNEDLAAEHTTMKKMASDTGGQAFYNTNGLAEAVAQAIDAGSNYYTLTYNPTNHNFDSRYRSIHVELSTAAPARGLTLSYRHGYFADDPDHPRKGDEPASTAANAVPPTQSYVQIAMSRGAPQPADVLFRARVLPASQTTEAKVAPNNKIDPSGSVTGPFRRYDVDIITLPQEFTLAPQPDGHRDGKVEFNVLVYDADGKLLNAIQRTIQLDLKPDTYATFMKGTVSLHLEISVPVRGDNYLRIGIHDLPTDRVGVVEIPVASVSGLPPPVPASPQPPPH